MSLEERFRHCTSVISVRLFPFVKFCYEDDFDDIILSVIGIFLLLLERTWVPFPRGLVPLHISKYFLVSKMASRIWRGRIAFINC